MITKRQILETFARAIQKHEGYFPPSIYNLWRGSRAWRNKNPGNLRYIKQVGSIGQDKDRFAIFKDYEAAWQALLQDIEAKFTGNTRTGLGPNKTILDFFKVYAPASDNNNPVRYASAVINDLNANNIPAKLETTLGQLLNSIISELNILTVLYNIKNQNSMDVILGGAINWLEGVFGKEKKINIHIHGLTGEPLNYHSTLFFRGSSYIPTMGAEIDRTQLQNIIKPLLRDEQYVWFIDADNLGTTLAVGAIENTFVSEINWFEKAEILATTEQLVHQFSFNDQRSEAKYEFYLKQLQPHWNKL